MLIGGESEGWPPRAVSSALRFSKQWKKPVGENTGSCRIGNSDRDLAGGVPGSIRRVICEGAFSKCRICCERRLADIEQQMRAVGYPREHMASVQPQVDGRYVPGSLVPNVKAILAGLGVQRQERPACGLGGDPRQKLVVAIHIGQPPFVLSGGRKWLNPRGWLILTCLIATCAPKL